MNKFKKIPKFKNEDEERKFWAKADTSHYFDVDKPVKIDISELKLSTQSISLRLPEGLLEKIKKLANKRDVPYQSFMKMLLVDKVSELN